MSTERKQAIDVESTDQAGAVEGSENYQFTVKLFEKHGKAWIGWGQTCPARLGSSWVALYKAPFPDDLEKRVFWAPADSQYGEVDTNHTWGTGWCASMNALNFQGKHVYVVKTSTTA